MAAPDVSSLTSSVQIFSSNTLPQIRAIHKALHAQIDDKGARLRTQVGGSYRELLGTADTIVGMNGDLIAVQSTLGTMGGRCGRAVVHGKVAGLGDFVKGVEVRSISGSTRLDVLAKTKLLGACALVVGRLLRGGIQPPEVHAVAQAAKAPGKGDRLVLAAKVLVLSRLLIKSFSDNVDIQVVSKAVEEAKKTLGRLRARLLRSVDKVLERVSPPDKHGDVLKALSAYSLATNSGATDVLRHFLHIRGDAMVMAFELEETERERQPTDVVKCMELYTNTTLTVQNLMPHKLTDALLSLKRSALLADETLRQVEALRLDIYEQWCGDEIQYFTPFIRHDDLNSSQAREMLSNWASRGGDILLQGLDKTLERMTEFKAVVDLRTTVLKVWISDGGRTKGFDASTMMKKIREVINKQMLAMLDTKVNKLRLVGSEVAGALEAWNQGQSRPSLWDEGTIDTDLGSGASYFTQEIISNLFGRDNAVARVVNSYSSWHDIIDDAVGAVAQLRRHRWDNDVEEIEDEVVIEQRQALLSKTDPQLHEDHLNHALVGAFEALHNQLEALWIKAREEQDAGHMAMFLTRVLRDIRTSLPKLDGVQSFGLELVPSLHEHIVAVVAQPPLEDFANSKLHKKQVIGRSLWEGVPELPNTPSPDAFSFLRNLVASAADAGTDLWSPHAVAQLKRHVAQRLTEAWLTVLSRLIKDNKDTSAVSTQNPGLLTDGSEVETETATGEAEADEEAPAQAEGNATQLDTPPAAQQRNDLLVQWLFDLQYLRCSLQGASQESAEQFAKLEKQLCDAIGPEGEEYKARFARAAEGYWKKTSLLFGLMA
jgi:conserved oligomeric Golgi complex subunit 1